MPTLHRRDGSTREFSDAQLSGILARLLAAGQVKASTGALGYMSTTVGLLVSDLGWNIGRKFHESYTASAQPTFPFGLAFSKGSDALTLAEALAGVGFFTPVPLTNLNDVCMVYYSSNLHYAQGQLVMQQGAFAGDAAQLRSITAGAGIDLLDEDDIVISLDDTYLESTRANDADLRAILALKAPIVQPSLQGDVTVSHPYGDANLLVKSLADGYASILIKSNTEDCRFFCGRGGGLTIATKTAHAMGFVPNNIQSLVLDNTGKASFLKAVSMPSASIAGAVTCDTLTAATSTTAGRLTATTATCDTLTVPRVNLNSGTLQATIVASATALAISTNTPHGIHLDVNGTACLTLNANGSASFAGNVSGKEGSFTTLFSDNYPVIKENDARLSNTRAPTTGTVTTASLATGFLLPQSQVTGLTTTLAGLVLSTDSRLSDSRNPLAGSVTTASLAAGFLLPQSQVTGLTTALAGLVLSTDSRLTDSRNPKDGSVTTASLAAGFLLPQAQVTGLATSLAAKANLAGADFGSLTVGGQAVVLTNDSRLTLGSQYALLSGATFAGAVTIPTLTTTNTAVFSKPGGGNSAIAIRTNTLQGTYCSLYMGISGNEEVELWVGNGYGFNVRTNTNHGINFTVNSSKGVLTLGTDQNATFYGTVQSQNPACFAFLSGGKTVTVGFNTETVIPFDISYAKGVAFYTPATGTFKPLITGFYAVSGQIYCQTGGMDLDTAWSLNFRAGGSNGISAAFSSNSRQLNAVLYLTGGYSYQLTAYQTQSTSPVTISGGPNTFQTYCSVALLA